MNLLLLPIAHSQKMKKKIQKNLNSSHRQGLPNKDTRVLSRILSKALHKIAVLKKSRATTLLKVFWKFFLTDMAS
jgi:hypothetical protein